MHILRQSELAGMPCPDTLMRVIDLFSGCGGLSLGFQNAGFDVRAAFDNWDPAIKVYEKNIPDHPIIKYDLGSFSGDAAIFNEFMPEMIVGGPPCQDFSSAGKRDETRGKADLTRSFAEIVTTIAPEWFVMENVARALASQAYAAARRTLLEAGYGLTETVLDASFCGVPQTRKRMFLIGQLGGPHGALQPYLERRMTAKPLTIREYLGDLIDVEHYYRHPRSYMRRGIFSVNEPSPTVRGVNRPIPPKYQPHSGDTAPVTPQLRPLTTKERSYIQTFPRGYELVGSKTDLEQMIGNAVPVKLAEHVAMSIADYRREGKVEHIRRPEAVQLALLQI